MANKYSDEELRFARQVLDDVASMERDVIHGERHDGLLYSITPMARAKVADKKGKQRIYEDEEADLAVETLVANAVGAVAMYAPEPNYGPVNPKRTFRTEIDYHEAGIKRDPRSLKRIALTARRAEAELRRQRLAEMAFERCQHDGDESDAFKLVVGKAMELGHSTLPHEMTEDAARFWLEHALSPEWLIRREVERRRAERGQK